MFSWKYRACFLILTVAILAVTCEEESCSKDDHLCDEEVRYVMVEKGRGGDEEQDDEKQEEEMTEDSTENASKQNKNTLKMMKSLTETEGQNGPFEACTKTEYEGELQRLLILHAGYKLTGSSVMVRVHCQPETDMFDVNGYYQTIGYHNDEEVLIVAMMPSQGLQPHAHDKTEHLTMGYGSVVLYTWQHGSGVATNETVTAGAPVSIDVGITHALLAGMDGAVYHHTLHTDTGDTVTKLACSRLGVERGSCPFLYN